jgi:hypothetical protein
MLGPVDYALWIAGFVLEAAAVLSIFYRQAFARYYSVCLYMACTFLVQGAQYICFLKCGFHSPQYFYLYYYSDSLLTVLLFFVVMHFYVLAFAEMDTDRYIRVGAVLLLLLTAASSFFVIRQHGTHLTEHFVVELGQGLYFVGTVLTYILWGAMIRLRGRPARLAQLVLALGIYYSATAGAYALQDLFPGREMPVVAWLPPAANVWLSLAWTLAFLRTKEEARVMIPNLAAKAR